MMGQLRAEIEAAILGKPAVGTHCAVSTGSTFRASDLEKAAKELAALPKPLVGIVCKPKFYVAVSVHANKHAGPLGPVPVFSKPDQQQDCLAFYDIKLLREHLSSNTPDHPRENPQ